MATTLKKILFVDDDEIVSELAIMIMEAAGFDVNYCESGYEALKQASSVNPQLILLDVMMPNMNGIVTLKKLREIPQTAHTPIIFLTGLSEAEHARTYAELGALGMIPKPLDPDTLCQKITHLWSHT